MKFQKASINHAIFPSRADYEDVYKAVFEEKYGSVDMGRLVLIDKINHAYLNKLIEIEARISVLEETENPPDLTKFREMRKKMLKEIFEKFAKKVIILDEMSATEVVNFFERY